MIEMSRPPEWWDPVHDTRPAQWVVELLETMPFASVGNIVPSCYESYVRILHPSQRVEMRDGRIERCPARWSDAAAENGRVAHRLAAWPYVCGKPMLHESHATELLRKGGVIFDPPMEGSLPKEVSSPLFDVLRSRDPHTACWFALWIGYGGVDFDTSVIETRSRQWYLFRGPLEALGRGLFDSSLTVPDALTENMVWAEDRSWFVATEIDLDSTYVGGSSELIGDIQALGELETYPAYPSDSVSWSADTVNPSVPLHHVEMKDDS